MQYIKIDKSKLHRYPNLNQFVDERFEKVDIVAYIIEDEVAGVVVFSGQRIEFLYVVEAQRRMGWGTDIINYHLRQHCDAYQRIAVPQHDSATLAFLCSQGFRPVGRYGMLRSEHVVPRILMERKRNQEFPVDVITADIEQDILEMTENLMVIAK